MALQVVSAEIEAGNADAASRWLRLGTLSTVTSGPDGPFDAHAVIEEVRRCMPDSLMKLVVTSEDPTTAEAEALIQSRFERFLSAARSGLRLAASARPRRRARQPLASVTIRLKVSAPPPRESGYDRSR